MFSSPGACIIAGEHALLFSSSGYQGTWSWCLPRLVPASSLVTTFSLSRATVSLCPALLFLPPTSVSLSVSLAVSLSVSLFVCRIFLLFSHSWSRCRTASSCCALAHSLASGLVQASSLESALEQLGESFATSRRVSMLSAALLAVGKVRALACAYCVDDMGRD